MWATIALTALTMTPAQAEKLELTNVRLLTSVLGQERKDDKVLPGEILVVAFDIHGLKAKDDGRVRFSMGMELTREGKTKPEFKNDPEVKESVLHLGGTRLPNSALAVIGLDTPAGKYTLKVPVTDLESKQTETLVRTFEVLPVALGFVRVGMSYNGMLPAPHVGVPGQTLLLNFALVGFGLDAKSMNPNVSLEIQIIDEATGKPTLSKPFSGEVTTVAKTFEKNIPFEPFVLHLSRAGKFRVELKATDNVSKKTAEHTVNLTVVENNAK